MEDYQEAVSVTNDSFVKAFLHLKQFEIDNNHQWYCTAHGASFDINGTGLNSNGSKGLTIYKTSLSGTSLRIFS